MAFKKVFVILVLVSSALAMPVQPVEENGRLAEAGAPLNVKVEDVVAVEESTTINYEKDSVNESSGESELPEELVHQDLIKRSIDEESSTDDLDTAAGTNVLRPLFVYRQQVAYRQRVKNSNRRGNRRV